MTDVGQWISFNVGSGNLLVNIRPLRKESLSLQILILEWSKSLYTTDPSTDLGNSKTPASTLALTERILLIVTQSILNQAPILASVLFFTRSGLEHYFLLEQAAI